MLLLPALHHHTESRFHDHHSFVVILAHSSFTLVAAMNTAQMQQDGKETFYPSHTQQRKFNKMQVMKEKEAPEVLLVDIRDIRELWREGTIPGSIHAPRGMLEFWVDPESPYHRKDFSSGKKFIFFCAGGLRSALAAQTAQNMGLKPVAHMAGGFGAWRNAEGPIIEKEVKLPK